VVFEGAPQFKHGGGCNGRDIAQIPIMAKHEFAGAPVRGAKADCHPPPIAQRIMYNLWNAWGHNMSWTAHYYDRRLNRVAVSRVFASKEDALRQACDLMIRKCVVRFVAGPNDERLDAVAITKWCKGHRTALKPPLPK